MYAYPDSAWKDRINMLGETGLGVPVKQAGWVRSLLSTLLATGKGTSRPGLFQAPISDSDEPLEWSREQQAAFIITLWNDLRSVLADNGHQWWIRSAFSSPEQSLTARYSILNQDMGVRAVLAVANDIFFNNADLWRLNTWFPPLEPGLELTNNLISAAIASLEEAPFRPHILELAHGLVRFDWRSADAPGVKERPRSPEAIRKRSYRGSGGYG